MDTLLSILKRQASSRFISMDDLEQGYQYPISEFSVSETDFQRAVIVTLRDGDGAYFDVILPKEIQMSDEQILDFNERPFKTTKFIYKSKRGQAYVYDFIE